MDGKPHLAVLAGGLDPGHDAAPVKGSAYSAAKRFAGLPANVLNPWHYPVEALCSGCGNVIREESPYAGWAHTGRKPGDPR